MPTQTTPDLKHIRFQRMVEEIEDYAILLLDQEGTIENWNKGAERIKGYKAEEIIGKNFRAFYTPEDRQNHVPDRLMEKAAREGKVRTEGLRVKKDGNTFWAGIEITAIHDDEANVIGFTKITRDLSDIRYSEEKLRRSEDRYLKMIAEVQDYAILLMDTQGNVLNWNKGAEQIKGYTGDEIIGRSFRQFYPAEDRASGKPMRLLEQARKEGRAVDEGWRLRKDGTRFWGSVTLTALHNEQGEVIGFSKVTRDLTAKKLNEETELHVQKMEARNRELEQLTYITSHDLQEPLNNITNLIGMLQEDYARSLPEQANVYLEFISGAAHRMSQLITELLNYGLLGRNSIITTVSCNTLAEEACADLDALIKSTGARVEVGALPSIPGFKTELRLLFQNLISNAIKYRKKGLPPQVAVTAEEQQDGVWQFAVADNGIGINPAYQERIFLIFQRLHSQKDVEGNGIGLAHCKKIVEMHNGRIWAESVSGQGSTFYFTINTNSLVR